MDPLCWESGFLTSVWEPCLPIRAHQAFKRVWGVLEHIVKLISFAFLNLSDFLSDLEHSVHESINLKLILRFSWLDHEAANVGPRLGWGVESIVHESLCNIFLRDSSLFLELRKINDELMGNSALLTLESDLEFLRKDCSHVVGDQNSVTTGIQQALLARHPDVGVGNGENAGITIGGTVYSTGGTACNINDLMAG